MHQNRSVLLNKYCKTRYVTSIFDVSQWINYSVCTFYTSMFNGTV